MTERVGTFWKTIIVLLILSVVFLSVNQVFHLGLFGFMPITEGFLYYIIACLLPLAFIIWQPRKSDTVQKIKWYDVILFILAFIIPFYLAINSQNIILLGWERSAPLLPTIGSIMLWFIILEGARRVAGPVLMLVCLVFSFFPLVAGVIPINFLQGIPFDFVTTATSHIMSHSSLLGVPIRTLGNLLIGFLIFGTVLVHTGGGEFFFKLAQGIFGRARGGTAKISVLSSAFFGMLSGSAVSNVVTTGAVTIPAMKKSGFSKEYAGAVEAGASTGGTITPPIMGSAAFIMASFLAIPYGEIVLAAAIPAFLFFLGLFIQVDGYAAKNNILGTPPDVKLPSVWQTLKEGWFYIAGLLLLVYLILVTKNEAQAPYFVSIFILVASVFNKKTRLNWKKTVNMIIDGGKLMAEMVTILAAVGFVVGALSITGVAFAFARELVAAAGGSAILILIAGALTSFILGMGVTVSAVYIFLAIIMAPALVTLGFDPLASHLFVLYWATVSYITPPVALAVFAATGISGGNPLKSSWIAMKLGSVKYFVPFFFVYNPALIGRGEPMEVIITFIFAVLGVLMLSSSLEGYLIGVGKLPNLLFRTVVFISGFLLFLPELYSSLVGLLIAIAIYAYGFIKKKSTIEVGTVNENKNIGG